MDPSFARGYFTVGANLPGQNRPHNWVLIRHLNLERRDSTENLTQRNRGLRS
jgi:hypothetical protein